MKVAAILLGLIATVTCAVVPAEVLQRDDGVAEFDQINWTGSLYEGGPEVEYWGNDLDDIDAQVQKDHPGLSIFSAPNVEDDVSPVDETPGALAERALTKRNTICITRFGFGDGFEMNTLWKRIKNAGGNCRANARRCIRVGCYKTAGIAFCNDNRSALSVRCNTIGDYARGLATGQGGTSCIWPGRTCGGRGRTPSHLCSTGIAGQRFSPGGTWNVIAGACGAFNANGWNVGS